MLPKNFAKQRSAQLLLKRRRRLASLVSLRKQKQLVPPPRQPHRSQWLVPLAHPSLRPRWVAAQRPGLQQQHGQRLAEGAALRRQLQLQMRETGIQARCLESTSLSATTLDSSTSVRRTIWQVVLLGIAEVAASRLRGFGHTVA